MKTRTMTTAQTRHSQIGRAFAEHEGLGRRARGIALLVAMLSPAVACTDNSEQEVAVSQQATETAAARDLERSSLPQVAANSLGGEDADVPQLGRKAERIARRSTRRSPADGKVRLGRLPGASAVALEGWEGVLTIRQQPDGTAEAELSMGTTDASGESVVNINLSSATAPGRPALAKGVYSASPARAKKERRNYGSVSLKGAEYHTQGGTVTVSSYADGKIAGRFALTMNRESSPDKLLPAEGEFEGNVHFTCSVLDPDSMTPREGKIATAVYDGSPHWRVVGADDPFCRQFL